MITIHRTLQRLTHPFCLLSIIALIAFSFLYLDLPIEQRFFNLHFRDHAPFLRACTQLGSGFILVPFLFSALFFRYALINPIWEERALFVSASIIFTGVLCWGLKCFFGRSRPDLWHNAQEFGFYWWQTKAIYWSFPSGHSTTIFSVAFALTVLFPRYWMVFVLSGLSIALTRVFLGYHYLSDVLAASYFTFIEVLLLAYFLNKKGQLSKALYSPSPTSTS